MSPHLRTVLVQLGLFGTGILLLYLAFKGQDLNRLYKDLAAADYRYVAASLAVLLAAHFIRAIRWKMLITTLGHTPPSSLNCFCAVMIAYLANLAVPRLGEISRCTVIYRTNRVPVNELIGTVITERIADVLMLAVLLLVVAGLESGILIHFIQSVQQGSVQATGQGMNTSEAARSHTMVLLLSSAGTLIVTALLILFTAKYWQRIMQANLVRRSLEFLRGIITGMKTIAALPQKALFIFWSVAIWGLYALSTYLVFSALKATQMLGFSQALYTLAAGSLGMIAPVQGGIGTYHFMVTRALVLLGITTTDGLAYATINHSSQLLLFLFAGSLSLGYVFLKNPARLESINQPT